MPLVSRQRNAPATAPDGVCRSSIRISWMRRRLRCDVACDRNPPFMGTARLRLEARRPRHTCVENKNECELRIQGWWFLQINSGAMVFCQLSNCPHPGVGCMLSVPEWPNSGARSARRPPHVLDGGLKALRPDEQQAGLWLVRAGLEHPAELGDVSCVPTHEAQSRIARHGFSCA